MSLVGIEPWTSCTKVSCLADYRGDSLASHAFLAVKPIAGVHSRLKEKTLYSSMEKMSDRSLNQPKVRSRLKERTLYSNMKKRGDRDLEEMTKSQLIDIIKWQRRVMRPSPMEKGKDKKNVSKMPTLETIKEVPEPTVVARTTIRKLRSALKGATTSFEVSLLIDNHDPLRQLANARIGVESFFKDKFEK